MPLPIDPLTLGTLSILAAGSPVCKPDKPTQINIVPKTANVAYDTRQSMAQVQTAQVDTINPYGFGGTSHTYGYMSGEIESSISVKLDHKPLDKMGANHCIWYKEITVNIGITPTIVIPREVARDPCMKRAVNRHELKHVMADRKIVNKYAGIIGKKLYKELESRGFSVAPVYHENAQAVATRMQETAQQIASFEFEKMGLERREVQQAIDSKAEYDAVSNACPHFKHPK